MSGVYNKGNDSRSNGNTSRIKQIQVIFLRHGEREDEVENYDKHQRTPKERVDPALTVIGHQQALGAWKKILAYVPNEKTVMVACSPLRRCIGTAMMVARAAQSTNTESGSLEPRFMLPIDNISNKIHLDENGRLDQADSERTIPILVMNGLGGCAAQMRHMGGIGKAVTAGWLECAASPGNDCGDKSSITPLQESLQNMALSAIKCQTGMPIDASNITQQGCRLQFWRESKYHYFESNTTSDYSALTELLKLQEHLRVPSLASNDNMSIDRQQESPLPMPKNAPSCDERFDQAVERAVLQTAHAGLDACILVSHREAIRWVETHWIHRTVTVPSRSGEEMNRLNKKWRRDPKLKATRTYCCVGDYNVSVDMTNSIKPQVLGWQSKKIVPWQQLKRDP